MSGLDGQRVAMVNAVVERRGGVKLADADVLKQLDTQTRGTNADLNTGLSSVKQACENCHRDYQ